MSMKKALIIGVCGFVAGVCGAEGKGALAARLLDNNLRCVDLSGLHAPLPLETAEAVQVLWRTEAWEHNTFDATDADSVGYPSLVRNDRGRKPDNKYYLYYAHHDPCSGIGCAIAETIAGPYRKLAQIDKGRQDSLVLANPHYPINNPPVSDPSHYSSPCVVWNEERRLWFMYFHYYNHAHEAWQRAMGAGYGHQMTGLATCADLSGNRWKVETNKKFRAVSVWDLTPVLPTTKEEWMNSQSTYHSIHRLPDRQWLAFMRGTSVDQVVRLGFAWSSDGVRWKYFPGNPVMHQDDGGGGQKGVYRPYFVGYLGRKSLGVSEYLLVWGESPAENDVPRVMYGYTEDFKTIRRDPRGYANWAIVPDGPVSPWREGNKLYLFAGKHVQVMALPE
ncbi:MAG: hypothetical protein PHU80_07410 [Kiritimatiellae bacterium]|nr:hypothetical protein [Kiritimatiellia bacterium]